MTSIRKVRGVGRLPEPGDAPDVEVRAADTPSRRRIASFSRYADAERAVDLLAGRKFPVMRAAIVGRDVQVVEQITGTLDHRPVTRHSTWVGALFGGMVGWIIGVFELTHPFVIGTVFALYGLLFGGIIGGLVGLVIHLVQRYRRGFSSETVLRPGRFELLVDDELAEEATRLLAHGRVPEPRSGGHSEPAVT